MEHVQRSFDEFAKQMNATEQRDSRTDIHANVRVEQINTNYCEAIISNLSTTGFLLSCHASFNNQQSIFIHIEGLQALNAKIQWNKDSKYGCQFANPLYPAVFDHLIARLC